MTETIEIISAIVTPVLVGIVGFFIRNLFDRFNSLEKKLNEMMVRHEGMQQRILNLEERVREVEEKIWDFIKPK